MPWISRVSFFKFLIFYYQMKVQLEARRYILLWRIAPHKVECTVAQTLPSYLVRKCRRSSIPPLRARRSGLVPAGGKSNIT